MVVPERYSGSHVRLCSSSRALDMSNLPLHPAFVHVPLGIAMILPLVAAAVTIAVWKGKLPRSALALVTGLQLLLAGSGFIAMALGHREEKAAAQVAPHDDIEAHEEAGETFVWVAVGVLALSVLPLVVPARRTPVVAAVVIAGTLVVAGLAVNAGEKGGHLVFEYGAGAAAPTGTPPSPASIGAEQERHSD
jgi:uncharacterized membrane protein